MKQTCIIDLVETNEQIAKTASLAKEIWTKHYTPIIGSGQVEYMIDKYQSEEAIKGQIGEGYLYFILSSEGKELGYLSLKKESATTLFLSKIYVHFSARGKGFGKELVNKAFAVGKDLEVGKIRLTVNKYNSGSIVAYEKMGFTRTRELITSIGNGYVMDDYEYTIDVKS